MDVRKGYKQTKFGIIPEEWEVIQLRDIATYRRGSFPQPYGLSKWYDDVLGNPFVQVFDVDDNMKLKPETKKRISKVAEKMSVYVKEGSVILSINGSLGRIALTQYDAYVDRTLLIFETYLVPIDLHYFIYSLFVLFQIEKEKAPGAILKTITEEHLSTFLLPVPPLVEQKAIGEALSEVDALLAALDAFIAKKCLIKQGAMQELLTSKRRLPGFSGEWKTSTLNLVAEIQPGINKSISEMGTGTLYVTVQDLYEGNSIPIQKLGRIRISETEIYSKSLIPGDIVFGKSSVKREGIGYPSQFLGSNEPVVYTGFAFRARARQDIISPSFLFYFLRLQKTRRWLIENSQASALTNTNQSIANRIPVLYPSIPEQQAIAEILSDMDAEIAALEQKREKFCLLKQGMLQELLTGRMRLI